LNQPPIEKKATLMPRSSASIRAGVVIWAPKSAM